MSAASRLPSSLLLAHAGLPNKLASMGFSSTTLEWVYSYLTGRKQCVVDATFNLITSCVDVNMGVPQDSVLGPLFFSLFINDVCRELKHTKRIIFADDVQIYLDCFPSELDAVLVKLQKDIHAVARYAIDNKLKLNLTKTKIMILGSPTYVNAIDVNTLPVISVGHTVVPFVSHVRNLGVIMQSNLSWSMHVSNLSSRIHGILHRLEYYKNSLSCELRQKLVSALIFPVLDYCFIIYNDVTSELNQKLQRLMNCAIRFIFNSERDVHITPYRHKLKWLDVKNRRAYFMCTMIYQISHHEAPQYLIDIFEEKKSNTRCSLRLANSDTFHIPPHRTSFYSNSFHLAGIYLWHSLPAEIVGSTSLPILKFKLFRYLFDKELELPS